jgi:hypothetical protein
MMLHKPILECLYGWGQVVQVSDDYLDMGGRKYALNELVSVCPIYHRDISHIKWFWHILGEASRLVRVSIPGRSRFV